MKVVKTLSGAKQGLTKQHYGHIHIVKEKKASSWSQALQRFTHPRVVIESQGIKSGGQAPHLHWATGASGTAGAGTAARQGQGVEQPPQFWSLCTAIIHERESATWNPSGAHGATGLSAAAGNAAHQAPAAASALRLRSHSGTNPASTPSAASTSCRSMAASRASICGHSSSGGTARSRAR